MYEIPRFTVDGSLELVRESNGVATEVVLYEDHKKWTVDALRDYAEAHYEHKIRSIAEAREDERRKALARANAVRYTTTWEGELVGETVDELVERIIEAIGGTE